jgi:hypothetical protein
MHALWDFHIKCDTLSFEPTNELKYINVYPIIRYKFLTNDSGVI